MSKKRNHLELARPTPDLLRSYVEKFEKDERYYVGDQAIIKLFKLLPSNKDLEDVLLKLSVINDLYSTSIFATFKMAKHIQSLDIDGDLADHLPEVVNRIADVTISGKNRRFFSFATKYCSWHDQDNYPISDSFVEKLILAYQGQYGFAQFKKTDLRAYPRFKKIVEQFQQHFGLSDFGLKRLDKFLWLYGKEKFPGSWEAQR
jgi:hypothetical protein